MSTRVDTERAAFLERVLDRSRSVNVVIGTDGRIRYASAAIDELFGVTVDEALRANIADWLHPDDLGRAVESLVYTSEVRSIRYFPMVFRVRHRDGHWVEVDVVSTNLLDDPLVGGILLSLRSADDRTRYVDPVRAIAAGASHEDVLDLVAAGVGRGGHELRPAFVAWDPDPLTGHHRRLRAVRAEPRVAALVEGLLGGDAWQAWRDLGPRELASVSVGDLPPDVAGELRDLGAAGFRMGAIAVGAEVVGLLLGIESPDVWQGDNWPPATVDHWTELLDLAAIAFDRHVAHTRLVHAATHDPLTGLANRRHFFDQLGRMVTRGDLAVCYADLDRFKAINDRFGHASGDAVLVEVARRLQRVVRARDLVARLGGDEFAIAVTGASAAGLDELTARLTAEVAAPLPTGCGAEDVRLSVGVAVLRPGETGDELVHRADQELLAAKRAGTGGPRDVEVVR